MSRSWALASSCLLVGCAQEVNTVDAPTGSSQADDATHYAVSVETPANPMLGTQAVAKVQVVPQPPWHMNLEFPAQLSMETPDGVTLPAAEQGRGDAERYDDDGLVFAVPFTPDSGGAKHFAGQLEFAVCGADACAPVSVAVDFTVDVRCREQPDTGVLC